MDIHPDRSPLVPGESDLSLAGAESAPYWESTAPGAGRRMPRADAVSDAPVLSLNGMWRFRLSPTAAGTGVAFLADDFDDSDWDAMPVPSHWVLEDSLRSRAVRPADARHRRGASLHEHGVSDPARPAACADREPDRRLPAGLRGARGFGPAVLRFQGVDSCAKVWLNGEELGWSTGSRLPFEFDAPVRAGTQRPVPSACTAGRRARTSRTRTCGGFPGSSGMSNCSRALPVRSTTTSSMPTTTRRRASARCGWMPRPTAVVEIPELGIRIAAGESVTLSVEPWSAERPGLYRGTLRSSGETVELADRVPSRRDRRRRVHGQRPAGDVPRREPPRAPPRHGANARPGHDDPGHRDDETREHRRRAHQPLPAASGVPAAVRRVRPVGRRRVDLETHGFIYEGWTRNPPAVPAWRDAIMDRLHRTVERDKNHPSIVVWSLANESMTGEASARCERWVRERDPSRAGALRTRPELSRLRLLLADVSVARRTRQHRPTRGGPAPEGITEEEDARRRRAAVPARRVRPRDGQRARIAAGLPAHHASHDRICGGFVWEWIDHGFNALDARTACVRHARRGCRLRTVAAAVSVCTGSSSATARRRRGSSSWRRRTRRCRSRSAIDASHREPPAWCGHLGSRFPWRSRIDGARSRGGCRSADRAGAWPRWRPDVPPCASPDAGGVRRGPLRIPVRASAPATRC